MKKTAAKLIASICLISGSADAGLLFSNFNLDETSISFDISGTISGPEPSAGQSWLFLVDAGGNGDYDPTSQFNEATITANISVNGTGTSVDNFWTETGGTTEDRLTLNRNAAWAVGDTLSGTFSAEWDNSIFEAGLPNGIECRWGRNNGTAMEGVLQGTAAIPEPATLGLLGLFSGGILAVRRIFAI